MGSPARAAAMTVSARRRTTRRRRRRPPPKKNKTCLDRLSSLCCCLHSLVPRHYRALLFGAAEAAVDEEEEESDEEAEEGGMYEMVHQDDDEADDCVLLTGPARKAKQGTEERRMEVKEERGEGGDKDVRECVICMEEFTAENPEMRTLCSCGENRARFHYPCLLLYLDRGRAARKQNANTCPTCRGPLYYEEMV